MGVECVVLRDRVWQNGELIEETLDWHAQDKEGNVWYFGESGEVNWAAGAPLALGSAVGAYLAARLAARTRAKVWVYRFLVIVVVLSIVHLIMVDSTKFLQHA